MVYLSLLFMLPLLSTIYGGTQPAFEALTQPTQVMRSRRPPLPQPYLHLPVFVDSRFPLVEKEQFTPSRGTGQEPLPEPVRDVLFPAWTNTNAPGVSGDSVRTSCKSNKMLVQVQRSILGTAQWERLSPSDQYELGRPMYFEAEALSMSEDQRLYLHLCYATPERSHNSTPQFPVVANYGCMVESKDSRSRFILYKTNAVRFSVDAFLFAGMTGQQLYMHCSIWVELYGPDSVCTCCDSNCSSAASTVTKVISSRPWTIDPKRKPTPALKRKKVSTATTTTTTKVAPQRETKSEVTEWRKSSHPEERTETDLGKVEDSGEEWPIGGRGVTWVEMEGEEELVKGFAVVEERRRRRKRRRRGEEGGGEEEEEKEEKEEEKEEKEKVAATRTIFEDIFDFVK
ncbi:hypothetical protein F7725_018221 [Dissostichus mawsoni]|uniref:ZP domain-containing protein n=1 Tax=Dissostichus mawsoni TaxID=36200 RepID=A0A7J5XQX3_DISMA|nr:hypothetical protein F7725_018221 [Dissostichus mawsoni]